MAFWSSHEEREILEIVRLINPTLTRHSNELHEIKQLIRECCAETQRKLDLILKALPKGNMALTFGKPQPDSTTPRSTDLSPTSGSETDIQTIPCTEVETDADGNAVTLNPANVTWAIDDVTIATMTQNSDGSATFQAVKPVPPATNPRTANITCTDTVTGVVGTGTLTVTTAPGGNMVLTFGPATP